MSNGLNRALKPINLALTAAAVLDIVLPYSAFAKNPTVKPEQDAWERANADGYFFNGPQIKYGEGDNIIVEYDVDVNGNPANGFTPITRLDSNSGDTFYLFSPIVQDGVEATKVQLIAPPCEDVLTQSVRLVQGQFKTLGIGDKSWGSPLEYTPMIWQGLGLVEVPVFDCVKVESDAPPFPL